MNPSQQQLERIVAYLDGELPTEESAQVEQQLAADEQFRRQLQGAERAWAALDQLPMASVGDEFSRTTMEMVVNAARQDVEARTIALPIQRRQRGTAVALSSIVAVLLGALFFRVGWKNPNRELLADLPVIQNVDVYSQFNSVDFLEQLLRHLGAENQSDPAEADQLQANLAEYQLLSTADDRSAWLESLPVDEQVTLRAKFNRFRDLSTQQRDALRQLHEKIEVADEREQLLITMFRYQHWLSGLSQSEQFKYRELSATDRALKAAREMKAAASAQEFELTPEQLRDLFMQVRPFVERIMDKYKSAFERDISNSSPQYREHVRSMSRQDLMRKVFIYSMRDAPEQVRKEFNDIVVDALPPDIGQAFQDLPLREKIYRFHAWVQQVHSHAGDGRRSRDIPEQELADFFERELEVIEKERLLALPRDEMQQQLKRMYRSGKSLHRRGPGSPQWGDGPPPPLGGSPPERRRDFRNGEGLGPGPPRRDGQRRGRRFEEGPDRRWPDANREGARRRRPQTAAKPEADSEDLIPAAE